MTGSGRGTPLECEALDSCTRFRSLEPTPGVWGLQSASRGETHTVNVPSTARGVFRRPRAAGVTDVRRGGRPRDRRPRGPRHARQPAASPAVPRTLQRPSHAVLSCEASSGAFPNICLRSLVLHVFVFMMFFGHLYCPRLTQCHPRLPGAPELSLSEWAGERVCKVSDNKPWSLSTESGARVAQAPSRGAALLPSQARGRVVTERTQQTPRPHRGREDPASSRLVPSPSRMSCQHAGSPTATRRLPRRFLASASPV